MTTLGLVEGSHEVGILVSLRVHFVETLVGLADEVLFAAVPPLSASLLHERTSLP